MTDLAERIRSYYEAAADPISAREILAPATRLEAVRPIQPRIAPARPGPWPALAGLVAALLAIGGVALLLRGGDGTVADETTLPATGGFSCPPGSTPDQPGPDRPRPPLDGYAYGATTFDPGSGRVLRLTSGPTSEGALWTFDVCTNAWASEPVPEDIAGLAQEFVYDVDSDRFIAFAARDEEQDGVHGQVWTYEPDGQVWTEKNEWAMGPVPEWSSVPGPQAVYDPVSGLVVVRESLTSAMWTYDVDTDTWTEIDQGTTLPPVAAVGRPFQVDGGTDWVIDTFAQALTYDASVDRLILYDDRSTWEFDIRAGRWEEQDAILPDNPGIGCSWGGPSGDEFAFDEANEVSVAFGGGTLATYDASEHTWTVLQQGQDLTSPYGEPAPIGQRIRMCFAMTYDSVNERIVVLGGEGRRLAGDPELDPERGGWLGEGWLPSDGVIAYDVATGEWTTLLEPTSG